MVVSDLPETSYHREEQRRFERLDRETPIVEAFVLNGSPGLPHLLNKLATWLRKKFGGYRNG